MEVRVKNILIVTLEQGSNYGGMLQAYALQESIRRAGHIAESAVSPGDLKKRAVKNIPGAHRVIGRLRGRQVIDKAYQMQFTKQFIDANIKLVDFNTTKKIQYDAYIVGSDQVWRRLYTYVPHNLLSFVKGDAVRISYAASFGKDNLDEYGDKLVVKTKKLAQKFDAISVREDTGVDVAKKYWGVVAEHHVDPTLLVDGAEYSRLIDEDSLPTHAPDGQLFAYVLDKAESKQGVIGKVADTLSLKPFQVIDGDENGGKPMPPVTQWLRSFRDAEYVVTDSFHGTVFSIIFNKSFIAIGNKDRGLARFTSLLKMFDLEDRLVESVDDVTDDLIHKPIDWKRVNRKIKSEQKRSMEYLQKHLGVYG